ncbi:13273_t:CDS:1, partial [Gigaspora rosea]
KNFRNNAHGRLYDTFELTYGAESLTITGISMFEYLEYLEITFLTPFQQLIYRLEAPLFGAEKVLY